jgi:hypothetical protein
LVKKFEEREAMFFYSGMLAMPLCPQIQRLSMISQGRIRLQDDVKVPGS